MLVYNVGYCNIILCLTNQPKENMNLANKLTLDKNNIINDIDVLFYDIENIEEQSLMLGTFLSSFTMSELESFKLFMIHQKQNDQVKKRLGAKISPNRI
jgi:hypothetical protein